MLLGILPFLVHWIALSQYGSYNNHDFISQTPKSHWTLLNDLADLPEENLESFLPQICNVILDRESLNNDELFDYFENIMVNKCIECFPFGFRVCGLLKASAPSPSDGLFRSGLLSTTFSQIAQRKEARFTRFQNMIEYVTCFGSKSAPLHNPHTQTRHGQAFTEELEDARREALRSQYFQDYGFMLDSLGRLGLELRKYPVLQRNYHLRSALSQYNSILFSRMTAGKNRALGADTDTANFHDGSQQHQQQWQQHHYHHSNHPFSGLNSGITATDIARRCPDVARYSLHYPLLHSKDRVQRILRFVPSECESLPSRDRCPYVVTVELLLEEGTRCNEEGLYAPKTGDSTDRFHNSGHQSRFIEQISNSADSAINLDILSAENLASGDGSGSDRAEFCGMSDSDCGYAPLQGNSNGDTIIGTASDVLHATSVLRGGSSSDTQHNAPVLAVPPVTRSPCVSRDPLLSARFRRQHSREIPHATNTGNTPLTAEQISAPLRDNQAIGLRFDSVSVADTSAAVLMGSEDAQAVLLKPDVYSDTTNPAPLQRVNHLNKPSFHYSRPALIAAKTLDDRRAVIRASSPFGHLPGWSVASFVVKSGDDIQKEALAMQLIEYMQGVFSSEGIDIYLKPYQILPTGYQAGLIEFLEGTQSIDRIKKTGYSRSDSGAEGDESGYDTSGNNGGSSAVSLTLKEHFERAFGPGYGFVHARAVQNFVRSLVGYSLVTYLLQVKDRHNANILIDSDGHIIHIDYGFILGDSPGFNLNFESAPFKLTRDYIDVMGGVDSAAFRLFEDLFLKGFTALRGHVDNLSAIIQLFYGDKRRGAAEAMTARLLSPASNQDVLGLIRDSLDNWRTKNYDWFQQQSNNIRM